MHRLSFAVPVMLAGLVACARTPEGLKVLDATAFRAAVEEGGGLVLDVRTKEEHLSARIRTPQTLIPVQELEQRLGELKGPKDRPILLYCRSGNRSAVAAGILLKAGFTDVRHLEGGIRAWKDKGLPTEP